MDVAGDQLGQFSLSNAGRAEKKEDEWVVIVNPAVFLSPGKDKGGKER